MLRKNNVMQNNNDKIIQEIVNSIVKNIKSRTTNIMIYIIALLFAIELNAAWLIWIFSILAGISFLIKINLKFNIFKIN